VVKVHPIVVDQLNAYDVLVNDEVVFTSAALQAFVNRGSAAEVQDIPEEPQGVSEEDEK
jgi:large subunit ribosomal protein L4